jgi:hypothetical protein
MIEAFIEKQPVDINEVFSTLITYAIDDVKDFGAKNTAFSKTLVLPGTKNNNELFGNVFQISRSTQYNPAVANFGINFNAAVGADIIVFADNTQVFKGILRLLEITVDRNVVEYEVAMFGVFGGFIAKMGNNKLEALDFSAYNHTYTVGAISGSWNTANAGAGYYYPLMDYGTYSTAKKNWQYGTFRPALYVKEYLDKIFAAAGYSYDCALFNTSRFKSLIVPHTQKKLQSFTTTLGSGNLIAPYVVIDDTIPRDVGLQKFDNYNAGLFTANAGFNAFTFTGATGAAVNITVNLEGDYNTGPEDILIYLIVDGINVRIDRLAATGTSAFSISYTEQVTVTTGDVVVVSIQSEFANPTYQLTMNTASIGFESLVPVLNPISIGGNVTLNDTIPKNILQKDFLSSILKLFNLYVFDDKENDKLLNIEPFVDFYANADRIDWTNKIDRSKPMRIKPMSELNSRYFEFNYKDDSDYWNDLYKKRYNETYNSFKFDSQFEFAKEVQKVELIFSPTPLVGYVGEEKVYSTVFKRTGEVTGVGEENMDFNIRILQAKKIVGVTSWNVLDGATVLGSYTSYGYAGHLDDPDAPTNDIGFGVPKELFFVLTSGALNNNQFNLYYSTYMAEITDRDSRLLEGTFRLTRKDIAELDFSKLIYVDGSLFRLNKIMDYNATKEDTCKVQLLKVINTIY